MLITTEPTVGIVMVDLQAVTSSPRRRGNDDATLKQRIQRGTTEKKKYTTCRLMKRLKSRKTKSQACIYLGGNKTYTLMYENNCPASYQCEYNPWSKEPSIDDVIDSLNSIKKGK